MPFFSSNRAEYLIRALAKAGLYSMTDEVNYRILIGNGTLNAALSISNIPDPKTITIDTLIKGPVVRAGLHASKIPTVTDYTQLTAEHIADYEKAFGLIEKIAKDNGFDQLHVEMNSMPVVYAAKHGYHLCGMDISQESELADAAAHYLERNYDFKMPENPMYELTMTNVGHYVYPSRGFSISAKDLINITHPDHPEISMYLEYLMKNVWKPGDRRLYYIKKLNE